MKPTSLGKLKLTLLIYLHGKILAEIHEFDRVTLEMHFYENHRLQTIFVLLQVLVIMAGSLLTGATMKLMGYQDAFSEDWSPFLRFIRNWGFLLIMIPLAWTFLTIALEQRTYWYSKRWTIGSGLVVLVSLAWLLVYAIGRSTSRTMMMMSE